MEIFVSRRTQCGAAVMLIVIVTFMAYIAIVRNQAAKASLAQELVVYEGLAEQAASIKTLGGQIEELDRFLGKNYDSLSPELRKYFFPILDGQKLEYAGKTMKYNREMRGLKYRFSDPANLPAGAKFGPLPREFAYPVLDNGERA